MFSDYENGVGPGYIIDSWDLYSWRGRGGYN